MRVGRKKGTSQTQLFSGQTRAGETWLAAGISLGERIAERALGCKEEDIQLMVA